jgi:3-deoxy-D-manno-octulosonic-acid transferase
VYLYRLLLILVSPLAVLFVLRQILRGKETLADLKERFGAGLDSAAMLPGATFWVHGASNGELTAGRALIEHALQRDPSLHIIVTVNSVSARQLVRSWGIDRVTVRLAPIDLKRTVHHFIACTQPDLLLTIENEIWPNRFTQCAQNNIPVIIVGARMSEKTAQVWHKYAPVLQGITKLTLSAVTALAPQDAASQERLVGLGLAPSCLLPLMNLKSGVDTTAALPADAATLRDTFQKDRTILAASTHEGEDAVLLESFAALRKNNPDLKLVIAPRHPARADAIAGLATAHGLTVARRSANDTPTETAVYLADTLGEMALWYAVAGFTFVGGSLVDRGGHTPFEPAQFGSVILHGPHVSNHAEAFDALARAGGAIQVRSATDLISALDAFLVAPSEATQIALNASNALAQIRTSETATAAFWASVDNATHGRKSLSHQNARQI